MVAKKVSIINMKGGVGKTTLSINLALYLSEIKKMRVLLIDLDPQANATIVAIGEEKLKDLLKNKKSIADLFINCYKKYRSVVCNDIILLRNSDDRLFVFQFQTVIAL